MFSGKASDFYTILAWDVSEMRNDTTAERQSLPIDVQYAATVRRLESGRESMGLMDSESTQVFVSPLSIATTGSFAPVDRILRTMYARMTFANLAAFRRSLETLDRQMTARFYEESGSNRIFVVCRRATDPAESDLERRIANRFFALDNIPSHLGGFKNRFKLTKSVEEALKDESPIDSRTDAYKSLYRRFVYSTANLELLEERCIAEEHVFRVSTACAMLALAADRQDDTLFASIDSLRGSGSSLRWIVAPSSDVSSSQQQQQPLTCYAHLPLLFAFANELLPMEVLTNPTFRKTFAENRDFFQTLRERSAALYALLTPDSAFRSSLIAASPPAVLSNDFLEALANNYKLARGHFATYYYSTQPRNMTSRWARAAPMSVDQVFEFLRAEGEGALLEPVLLQHFMDDVFDRQYHATHLRCGTTTEKCGGSRLENHHHYTTADDLFKHEYVALRINRRYVSLSEIYYSLRVVYEQFSASTASMAFGDLRRLDDEGNERDDLDAPLGYDISEEQLVAMLDKEFKRDAKLQSLLTKREKGTYKGSVAELQEKIEQAIYRIESPLRLRRLYRCMMHTQARRVQEALVNNVFVAGGLHSRFAYIVLRRDLLPIIRTVALGRMALDTPRTTAVRTAPVFPLLLRSLRSIQRSVSRPTPLTEQEFVAMNPESNNEHNYDGWARRLVNTRVLDTWLVNQNVIRAALRHVNWHHAREAHILAATSEHFDHFQLLSEVLAIYGAEHIVGIFHACDSILADKTAKWNSTLHSVISSFSLVTRIHYMTPDVMQLIRDLLEMENMQWIERTDGATVEDKSPMMERYEMLYKVVSWYFGSNGKHCTSRHLLALYTGADYIEVDSTRTEADGKVEHISYLKDDAGVRYCQFGEYVRFKNRREAFFACRKCATLAKLNPAEGSDKTNPVNFIKLYYEFVCDPEALEVFVEYERRKGIGAGDGDDNPERPGQVTQMSLLGDLFLQEFYNKNEAMVNNRTRKRRSRKKSSKNSLHLPFLGDRFQPLLDDYYEEMAVPFEQLRADLEEENRSARKLVGIKDSAVADADADYAAFIKKYFDDDMCYEDRVEAVAPDTSLREMRYDVMAKFFALAEWTSLVDSDGRREIDDNDDDNDDDDDDDDNDDNDDDGNAKKPIRQLDMFSNVAETFINLESSAPGGGGGDNDKCDKRLFESSFRIQVDPLYLSSTATTSSIDVSVDAFEHHVRSSIENKGKVRSFLERCKSNYESVLYDCSFPIYSPTIPQNNPPSESIGASVTNDERASLPVSNDGGDLVTRSNYELELLMDAYLHVGLRYALLMPNKHDQVPNVESLRTHTASSRFFKKLADIFGYPEDLEEGEIPAPPPPSSSVSSLSMTTGSGIVLPPIDDEDNDDEMVDLGPPPREDAAVVAEEKAKEEMMNVVNLYDFTVSSASLNKKIDNSKRYEVMVSRFAKSARKVLSQNRGSAAKRPSSSEAAAAAATVAPELETPSPLVSSSKRQKKK